MKRLPRCTAGVCGYCHIYIKVAYNIEYSGIHILAVPHTHTINKSGYITHINVATNEIAMRDLNCISIITPGRTLMVHPKYRFAITVRFFPLK